MDTMKFIIDEFLPVKLWNKPKEIRRRTKANLENLIKKELNERERRNELTTLLNKVVLKSTT